MQYRSLLIVSVGWVAACSSQPAPQVVFAPTTSSATAIDVPPETLITESTRTANDQMGLSVQAYDNMFIVGVPGDDNSNKTDVGAGIIYVKDVYGAWTQMRKVVPNPADSGTKLGYKVGMNTESALVAAPFVDDAASSGGGVWVFNRDKNGPGQWGQETVLYAQSAPSPTGAPGDDAVANGHFGIAFHMSFALAAVGSDVGNVYLFGRDYGDLNKWGFSAKVSGNLSEGFGKAVATARKTSNPPDLLLVGAPLDDTQGVDAGAAYLYEVTPGAEGEADPVTLVTKLLPDAASAGHGFGTAVALTGDLIAIGAPNDSQKGSNSGSVYVFARNQGGANAWGKLVKLYASDGAANHRFGADLSISGTTLTVGAPGANKVYVFGQDYGGLNAWGEATKLSPSNLAAGDVFGAAVSVSKDMLVVGEATTQTPANAGAAYVFELIFLGRACQDESQCKSHSCIDGVCCDTLCAGACDHCLQSLTGLEDGRCGPAVDATPCDDGDACTQTASCIAGTCIGANPIACLALDQCHAAGTCDPSSGECSNPPKAANAPCDDENPCFQTDVCDGYGTCVGTQPKLCPPTDACHTTGQCNPVDGTCSNPNKPDGSPCSDQSACTQQDSCQGGSCVGAHAVVCLAMDQCHAPGVCNPNTGTCSNPSLPNGTACNDGLFCTVQDVCGTGGCQGVYRMCTEGVSCKDGACDEELDTCSGTAFADNTACDDGNPCSQGDFCTAGRCGGTAFSCDDSDSCTLDLCDGEGGCERIAATAACDDGNACSHGDLCAADGSCSGASYDCDDHNPCTDELCNGDGTCTRTFNTAACDDGNACTTVDVCESGACRGTHPVSCQASDACHDAGVCEPATGVCTNPERPAGTPCDDGAYCTMNDVCTAGACHGVARTCDAGVSCRGGTCDETNDRCDGANLLNGSPCNDGNWCTSDDACQEGVCSGVSYSCDDGDVCTSDACNGTGGCTRTSNRAACDDSEACTVADVCFTGNCHGLSYSCDDNDPCTTDICDGLGSCTHSFNTASCDDGDACTGGDHCAAGVCVSGSINTCVDSGPSPDGGPIGGDSFDPSGGGDPVPQSHDKSGGCQCSTSAATDSWLGFVGLLLLGRGLRRSRRRC